MKTIKQKKNLALNKLTIVDLQKEDLDSIKGGTTYFTYPCNYTLVCTDTCPEISLKQERCN